VFLYVLRNADRCVFDFSVPKTDSNDESDEPFDEFDRYIRESEDKAVKELRDMNIFKSVHGHRLKSPIFPGELVPGEFDDRDLITLLKEEKLFDQLYQILVDNDLDDLGTLREIDNEEVNEWCDDLGLKGVKKLKFKKLLKLVRPVRKQVTAEKLHYERETLRGLVRHIKTLSNQTVRFVSNVDLLTDQIEYINACSELSLEKRIAACNSKLKWFLFDKERDEKETERRRLRRDARRDARRKAQRYETPSIKTAAKMAVDVVTDGVTDIARNTKFNAATAGKVVLYTTGTVLYTTVVLPTVAVGALGYGGAEGWKKLTQTRWPWRDRSLKIKNAIITFNSDTKQIEQAFKEGMDSLVKQLRRRNEKVSEDFHNQLIANKEAIIEAITKRKQGKKINKTIGLSGVAATALGVLGMGAVAVATGGLSLVAGGIALGGIATVGVAVNADPDVLPRHLKESDLEELEYFDM